MGRIDVTTLVLAFEKRIEALEKNPPDKVPTGVILNMLNGAIDTTIREHFVHLARKEIKELVDNEFKKYKNDFVNKSLKNIFKDQKFKLEIEKLIKSRLIRSLDK